MSTTIMGRDLTNEKAWCANLMSTTEPQANGKLAKIVNVNIDGHFEYQVGYCCLGIGCVQAGVVHESTDSENDYDDPDEAAYYFGTDGVDGLAPREFVEWLGFEAPLVGTEWDLVLDWPVEWHNPYHRWVEGDNPVTEDGVTEYIHDIALHCSGLNDQVGLTFAQIGQLVDYIGLLGVKE